MAEDLIPPGKYAARPVEWQLSKTSAGAPQVEVKFEITQACAHTGLEISWFGFFTDKTKKGTVQSLQFMGSDLDFANFNKTSPADVEVSLKIEHDTYEGVTRAKVRFVNDPNRGGLVSAPMDDMEALMFAKRMQAEIAALGNGKPAQKQDDIPF